MNEEKFNCRFTGKAGATHIGPDGNMLERGDIIALTPTQFQAFSDRFVRDDGETEWIEEADENEDDGNLFALSLGRGKYDVLSIAGEKVLNETSFSRKALLEAYPNIEIFTPSKCPYEWVGDLYD